MALLLFIPVSLKLLSLVPSSWLVDYLVLNLGRVHSTTWSCTFATFRQQFGPEIPSYSLDCSHFSLWRLRFVCRVIAFVIVCYCLLLLISTCQTRNHTFIRHCTRSNDHQIIIPSIKINEIFLCC